MSPPAATQRTENQETPMPDITQEEVSTLKNHGWGYFIIEGPENRASLKSLEERGYVQLRSPALFTLTGKALNVIS
jgi:hypothetical protein